MRIRLIFLILSFSSWNAISQQPSNWWNKAVFYEVFVRSFYDNNGDGKGDLKGLISKLDYLNDGNQLTDTDLGIDAIWLMPVMPSPSYHGYDVTDYYGVESDYGNIQLFREFIDSAHQRGIRVIIDLVMNHSSSQHPWFLASRSSVSSPYRDWYIWKDTNPAFKGPWGQDVWHAYAGKWYYGLFWSGMPDLNYKHSGVQSEMKKIARYWIDSMHVDGFRLDAVQYLVENGNQLYGQAETFSYLQDWKSDYLQADSEAMCVGEVWSNTSNVLPYVQPGRLDLCFEFELAQALLQSINAEDPALFADQLNTVTGTYPVGTFATFLTNHDMNRVIDQLGGSIEKNKLAASVYLSLPGTPFIYYGEEIGMTGTGADEVKRRPMQWNNSPKAGFTSGNPWTTINPEYTTVNVANQISDSQSLLATYRKLIALRHASPALSGGEFNLVGNNQQAVSSYLRFAGEEWLLVLHNFSAYPVSDITCTIPATLHDAGTYAIEDLLDQTANPAQIDFPANPADFIYTPGLSLEAFQTRMLRVSKPVGFSSPTSFRQLNGFPNPSNSLLHFVGKPNARIISIAASDIAGKPHHLQMQPGNQVDISSLEPGIYLLHVVYNDQSSEIGKFIRQ